MTPVPGSRTWIAQQAAKQPLDAVEAAREKKKLARAKRKQRRKELKEVRRKEGWVREINAWGEKGGWVLPPGAAGTSQSNS
jgi:hypothetical protein